MIGAMRPNVEIADQEREKGLEANLSRRDVSTLEFGDEAAGSGRDVQVRSGDSRHSRMPMEGEHFCLLVGVQLRSVGGEMGIPGLASRAAARRLQPHAFLDKQASVAPPASPNSNGPFAKSDGEFARRRQLADRKNRWRDCRQQRLPPAHIG